MPNKFEHIVLVVDDDEGILKALRRLLSDLDVKVIIATSGAEALDIMKDREVSLIISDQRMPKMTGVEFLRRSREISPNSIRILLTGYADIDATIDAINSGAVQYYFNKPWDDETLLSRVRESLDLYKVRSENKRLNKLIRQQNEKLKEFNKTLEQKVEKQTEKIKGQHKELANTFMETIKAFSTIVGLRFKEVGSHSQRVGTIVKKMILKDHQIDNKERKNMIVAAFLHDIGKISIPDRIIEKDKELRTIADIEEIKKHPVLGQSCVSVISGFEDIGLIIRYHHENYDGTGYPDGFREEEIPLGSRMIRIADAFDKLAFTDRYPTMKALADATAHLVLYSGSKFDPVLVKKFLELDIGRQFLYRETAETHRVKTVMLGQGMVVAEDVYTRSGMFILPKGAKLSRGMVSRLIHFDRFDPIPNGVLVEKKVDDRKGQDATVQDTFSR